MQEVYTNRERSERTTAVLLRSARELFVAKGYAETSTPEIVAAAGITRGALYHHFADKRALFRAVIVQEAKAVATAIEQAAAAGVSAPKRETRTKSSRTEIALAQLIAGGAAYLEAMGAEGRTRLMLIEGPSVLGLAEMDEIDRANAGRTLEAGLAEALGSSTPHLKELSELLSAAFDRAALAIDAGAAPDDFRGAIEILLSRVVQLS
ncbi:transposon Tn10 TetC protein [Variibacter gotjawalensis]|uniref:Transposon Tn10 TetC protein n=1 Tax=Variibacter gotjawalensis TaxID=1333996 RepID=A0A0S3PQF2_9BRAD|nr:helix-turn-helix domain-containing protein [Variibacter gotjawalensis]NIK48454.1 AcrR family transcriptional regulator [Variibacter gotjawalensis]RZS50321.1 TetR family transcriptional regulator [Variibacter gotjawalensis]BAT58154.1 transposon Tn10 TetC protein [Variibacter gotjawalensis]